MQLATHELAKSGSKPAAVAQAMGYGSEAAFSRALSAVGLTQADLATFWRKNHFKVEMADWMVAGTLKRQKSPGEWGPPGP